MRPTKTRRDLGLLVAGAIVASLLVSPVGAHVTDSISHVWTGHIKAKVQKLAFTKAQSDSNFVGTGEMASDADELDGKNSTEFRTDREAWHLVGAQGEPAFNDGNTGSGPQSGCYWSNLNVNSNAAGFYKDADDVVHFKGAVKAIDGSTHNCNMFPGSDIVIFQLPSDYRPDVKIVLAAASNLGMSRVNVFPAGWVEVEWAFLSSAETSLSLDGLTYRAGDGS